MNIYEVNELGPIVFSNEDAAVLITINGSYLNWFNVSANECVCINCRSFSEIELYKLTWVQAMKLAESWFNEVMGESEEGAV